MKLRAPLPTGIALLLALAPTQSNANTPPTITLPTEATTAEDVYPLAVPISWMDPDGLETYQWSFESSDSTLVAPARIRVTAGSKGRLLVLEPTAGTSGQARVRVTALDHGNTATASINVTVMPRAFRDHTTISNVLDGAAWTAVDVNADGNMDLVVNATVRFGGGDRPFSTVATLPGSLGTPFLWRDFDGDGRPDFWGSASNGRARAAIQVPLSGPGLQFIPDVGGDIPYTIQSVDAGDLDGDGDTDLFVVALGSTQSAGWVGLNDGHGNFSYTESALPVFVGSAALGDYDKDGDLDVLATGRLLNTSVGLNELYLNDGRGHFTPSGAGLPSRLGAAAGFVDVDGDGWLDVWMIHRAPLPTSSAFNEFSILRRESMGFREIFHLPSEIASNFVRPAWGDFDGDGFTDLIAPIQGNDTELQRLRIETRWMELYSNDGRGHLDPAGVVGPIQTNASQLANLGNVAADFDGDGALDLVDNSTRNQLKIRRNLLGDPASLPSPPGGLRATASGNRITFEWQAAIGWNRTASPTYNVRVGTRPGANDVVPSMSLPSGTRLIAAPGNAGFLTSLTVDLSARDLPPTPRLYWSVQTVDAGLRGSPWAPEVDVEAPRIPNSPPVLGILGAVLGTEDQSIRKNIRVKDDLTPPDRIQVQLFPENTRLLPVDKQSARWAPTPEDRSFFELTFVPAPDAFGSCRVRVVATDLAGASTEGFVDVQIAPVPDPPRIQPGSLDLQVLRDGVVREFPIRIEDPDTDIETLQVELDRLPGHPFREGVFSLAGSGSQRVLRVDPASTEREILEVGLSVTEPGGTRALGYFRFQFVDNTFETKPSSLASASCALVDAADVTGEGIPNLIVPSADGLSLQAARLTPTGFEVNATLFGIEGAVYSLDWTDLDGDGALDSLVAGGNGPEGWVKVYTKSPDGFRLKQQFQTGATPVARFSDLDADGDDDIVMWEATSDDRSRLVVFRNERGSFVRSAELRQVDTQPFRRDFWLSDLNGDGLPELVAYPSRALVNRDGIYAGESIQLHSVNGLGLADLVGADGQPEEFGSYVGTNGIQVLAFPGGGPAGFVNASPFAARILAGDFDNDGRGDLLIWRGSGVQRSPDLLSFDPWGRGFFLPAGGLDTLCANVVAADFDGDGSLDLATADGSVRFLHNTAAHPNPPPTTPAGLEVRFEADGAVVSWQPAADSNQPGGLTYNLRIGTVPDRGDILSPDSLPDGRRMLPRNGNCGWSTRRRIRGLVHGQVYHAAVQAVDASFQGGPFSSELTFALPEARVRIASTAPGSFELVLQAGPNEVWVLESSVDLGNWTAVSELTTDANGRATEKLSGGIPAGEAGFHRFRRRADPSKPVGP